MFSKNGLLMNFLNGESNSQAITDLCSSEKDEPPFLRRRTRSCAREAQDESGLIRSNLAEVSSSKVSSDRIRIRKHFFNEFREFACPER